VSDARRISYIRRVAKNGIDQFPLCIESTWTKTSTSLLYIIHDYWNIPKNTNSPLNLPFHQFDTNMFLFTTNNTSSLITIKLNGGSTNYNVSPEFGLCNLDLTSVTALNPSTTDDQVLELIRVVRLIGN
jgi:hypothetical protein